MVRLPLALGIGLSLWLAGCGQPDVVFPDGTSWGQPPRPSYTAQGRLAITDNGDDTLAFVTPDSLSAPRVLGLATLGNNPIELEGPHHLTKSPDGKFIYYNLSNYVTNGGSGPHGSHGNGTVPGYMVKLDARTNRPAGQVLVDRSPGDVVVSPDGKVVYVSHYDLARLNAQLLAGKPPEDGYSTVVAVDAEQMAVLASLPVCPTAHGMGFSPDGTRLYVTCSQSDQLAVLDVRDPRKPAVLAKVPVGPAPGPAGDAIYAPYALSVQSNGVVWVSDNGSQHQPGDVRAYDPQTGKMDPQKTVRVGGLAMFAAFSEDEKTLYVPHQGDDVVTAVDVATLQTRALPLPKDACLSAHVLRLLPGGQGAAVVCEGDHINRKGSVVFIDLGAWTVAGHVEVGLFPDGIIYLPPSP